MKPVEKGKVIEAKAAKGEKLLQKLLDTDEGSRYVGEIAIGTNEHINRFTKNMHKKQDELHKLR